MSPILSLDFIGKILVHTLAFSIQSSSEILLERKCAEVAQLVEHSPEKAGVHSSILCLGTIISSKNMKFLDILHQ